MGVKENHDKVSMNISIEYVVFISLNPLNKLELWSDSFMYYGNNYKLNVYKKKIIS